MIRTALGWIGVACLTLALLELGTWAAVRTGLLDSRVPSARTPGYWRGDHPVLGVWRHPGAELLHETACFAVPYRTNSVGMRDVERARRAAGPRVVVLGDSFLAGWGVRAELRTTDRLARRSRIPHLNFAMAHFGPYQAYLAYRELAKDFDHDAVILGLLPANDFRDIDVELSNRMGAYAYKYRPYLVGEPPRLRHLHWRQPCLLRWLREHSYAWNALLRLQRPRGVGILSATPEELERLAPEARRRPSWYYDYDEADIGRLVAILERLVSETGDRRVAVLLLPTVWDFRRYAVSGPPPLPKRLAPVSRRLGFTLLDLLPPMAKAVRRPEALFHPCDYHWNAAAHGLAADIVWRELGDAFYEPLAAATH